MEYLKGLQKHPFHLVDYSPWPIFTSFAIFGLAINGVLYFHDYSIVTYLSKLVIIFLYFSCFYWWRDVVREATLEGHHTKAVQTGLRYGMLLFILSEIMFFSAFFWAFFHSSLAPTIEIGSIWPPRGIIVFNAMEVPLLNTLILLLSGASITWAHYAITSDEFDEASDAISVTVALSSLFTFLQLCEYIEAGFRISDGIYGSVFFLATGFHGFHVLVGTVFIIVCYFRNRNRHFTSFHHVGFECAAWYWHFVDVVWLFLFVTIYWWGNKSVNEYIELDFF